MTLLRIVPKLSLWVVLHAGIMACAPPDDAHHAAPNQGVSAQEEADSTHEDAAHEDSFPPPPTACGGADALTCDEGQFCNTERAAGGEGCEAPQGKGLCEPVAEVCTLEYRPVCGCDHRTYPTACRAHFYGVAVLHDGACKPDDCAAAGGTVVEAQSAEVEASCPVDREEKGLVQTPSSDATGADAVCCVPRAAPVCRVVELTSLKNEALAEPLHATSLSRLFYDTPAYEDDRVTSPQSG